MYQWNLDAGWTWDALLASREMRSSSRSRWLHWTERQSLKYHKHLKSISFFILAWQLLTCDVMGLLVQFIFIIPQALLGYSITLKGFNGRIIIYLATFLNNLSHNGMIMFTLLLTIHRFCIFLLPTIDHVVFGRPMIYGFKLSSSTGSQNGNLAIARARSRHIRFFAQSFAICITFLESRVYDAMHQIKDNNQWELPNYTLNFASRSMTIFMFTVHPIVILLFNSKVRRYLKEIYHNKKTLFHRQPVSNKAANPTKK
ncbi:hypothetical protein Ddc_10140 [Ditylenchus destructor]|nr:hypothetical protein Ddc_10140 [Ditylenchus destructor]